MGRELSDLTVIKLVLRLDADLHAGITLAAQESKRSLNSEVITRLRESLVRTGQLTDTPVNGQSRAAPLASPPAPLRPHPASDFYSDAFAHHVYEALPELNYESVSEQAFIDIFRTLPAEKQLAVLTLMK